jgi:hypothetical protein
MKDMELAWHEERSLNQAWLQGEWKNEQSEPLEKRSAALHRSFGDACESVMVSDLAPNLMRKPTDTCESHSLFMIMRLNCYCH